LKNPTFDSNGTFKVTFKEIDQISRYLLNLIIRIVKVSFSKNDFNFSVRKVSKLIKRFEVSIKN